LGKRVRKVKVLLRGGLGNQLFQYFTGVEIVQRFGGTLLLDTSLLPTSTHINRSGVSVFPNAIKFDHIGEIKRGILHGALPEKFALILYTGLAQLNRFLNKFLYLVGIRSVYLFDEHTINIYDVAKENRDITIGSLCLTSDPQIDPSPEQLFSLSNPSKPSSWFLAEQKLIESVRPIAIHIRLGDHSRLGGTIDVGYIKRALAWIEVNKLDGQVWVFSDEPERVSKILESVPKNFRIIDSPEDSEPVESLALLAKAKILIMARSTFSFWAARLGTAQGNLAIMNKDWIESHDSPIYFKGLDKNWIQI
jgi:hypothetical protein